MASGAPDVTVVIPVRDGAAFIGEQLDSLAAQQTSCSWELVVADNGSTDGTVEVIRRHPVTTAVPVRIVDAGERPDGARACDVGARAARGRILVFCDADDVTEPTWVEAYWQALRDRPPSAAAGPVDVGRLNPRWLADWALPLHEPVVTPLGMRHGWGGNMAFHAEAWRQMGVPAGGFTIGFGDVVPFARAHELGLPFVWVDAPPLHYRLSRRRRTLLRKAFLHGMRLVRFVDHYPEGGYDRPRARVAARNAAAMAAHAAWTAMTDRTAAKGLLRSTCYQLGILAGLAGRRRRAVSPPPSAAR